MTVHYRTQGFVFKREDRLESDRTFSVFTKDFGKIDIFAKSIRAIASKLKGGIDIFSLSEVEFIQGKNRKTLTDATFIERFKNIIESPEKIEIAGKVSGLLNDFIRGQEPDEKIWNFVADFSQKLNSNWQPAISNQLGYFYFFWNFISVLGYKPELYTCACCSQTLNPHSLYFSFKEGGVMCNGCFLIKRDGVKITSDTVKVLRIILKEDWEILSKLKIDFSSRNLLEDISGNYYNYLINP